MISKYKKNLLALLTVASVFAILHYLLNRSDSVEMTNPIARLSSIERLSQHGTPLQQSLAKFKYKQGDSVSSLKQYFRPIDDVIHPPYETLIFVEMPPGTQPGYTNRIEVISHNGSIQSAKTFLSIDNGVVQVYYFFGAGQDLNADYQKSYRLACNQQQESLIYLYAAAVGSTFFTQK